MKDNLTVKDSLVNLIAKIVRKLQFVDRIFDNKKGIIFLCSFCLGKKYWKNHFSSKT